MKILLVNEVFYPDEAATGQYSTELALTLAQKGLEVEVLTGVRGYLNPKQSFASYEVWNAIKIHRVWSPYFLLSSKLGKLLYSCLLNLSLCFRFLLLPRYDAVIMLTAPPLIGCFFPFVVALKRLPLYQWLMDINPEQGVRAGWLGSTSIFFKLLKNLQSYGLKYAKKSLVLDRYMKELLVDLGVSENKIKVLPLWGDQDGILTDDIDITTFRTEHKLQDNFVVMYAGNHSLCHPVATVLSSAKELHAKQDLNFMFIGGGARVKEVTEWKESHQLNNIKQLDYQPRDQLANVLSAADLHVISMGEAFVGVVHPSKVYPLLVLGKPFIYLGPKASPISDILNELNFDWQLDHGDVEGFCELINWFKGRGEEEKQAISKRLVKYSLNYRKDFVVDQLVQEFKV